MDKLEHPSLPCYEAFCSSLKQRNVLEEKDNEKDQRDIKIIGREHYATLEDTWKVNSMETFRDLLIYYNNLDVAPFVKATTKLQDFYVHRNIDMFKDAVSVPGIARRWLYKTAQEYGTSFGLIHQQDEDLYHTIRKNIVGGPSIVFTRDHEVGKTSIRQNQEKPCRKS